MAAVNVNVPEGLAELKLIGEPDTEPVEELMPAGQLINTGLTVPEPDTHVNATLNPYPYPSGRTCPVIVPVVDCIVNANADLPYKFDIEIAPDATPAKVRAALPPRLNCDVLVSPSSVLI